MPLPAVLLARLAAAELAAIGLYVFGVHWKPPLAARLHVSLRLVKYWAAGSRTVSVRHTVVILGLAQARYDQRRNNLERAFEALLAALSSDHAALFKNANFADLEPLQLLPRLGENAVNRKTAQPPPAMLQLPAPAAQPMWNLPANAFGELNQ